MGQHLLDGRLWLGCEQSPPIEHNSQVLNFLMIGNQHALSGVQGVDLIVFHPLFRSLLKQLCVLMAIL